jgi:hypothetical protein
MDFSEKTQKRKYTTLQLAAVSTQLDVLEVLLTVLVTLAALQQLGLTLQTQRVHSVDVYLGVVLAQIPHHALALVHDGFEASVALFVLLVGGEMNGKRSNTLRQNSDYTINEKCIKYSIWDRRLQAGHRSYLLCTWGEPVSVLWVLN